jgi:hypothetical protein
MRGVTDNVAQIDDPVAGQGIDKSERRFERGKVGMDI